MKKVLGSVLFLFALSSLAYAEDDAAKVLDKMRDKIEKEDAEKAKAAEAQATTNSRINKITRSIKLIRREL